VHLDEEVVYGVKSDGTKEVLGPALKNDHSLVFVSWTGEAWEVDGVTAA